MHCLRAPLITACFLAFACSSSNRTETQSSFDAGAPASGKAMLRLAVQAPNSAAAPSSASAFASAAQHLQSTYGALSALSPSDFCNTEIASGPPNSFSITIRKMTLSSSDATKPAIPIFDEPAGKTITIAGSRVDLSDMFTHFDCIDNAGNPYTLKDGESCDCGFDADNNPVGTVLDPSTGNQVCPWDLPADSSGAPDGGAIAADGGSHRTRGSGAKVATLEAAPGTYDTLQVEFSRKAQISGCVTGNFCAPDAQAVHGLHTYCTQASKAFYEGTGGGENADFEDMLPGELMDFDLMLPCKTALSETVPEQYSIRGGLELTEGASAPLNLVIDVNRMLRFYNQSRPESPCGSGPSTSYFFTTVFDSSVFVFAGKPGSIQGYQLLTAACVDTADADVPADYVCTDNPFVVAVWLTVILDDQGTPILASFQPDDDNTLTVIKGATYKVTSFGQQWDPDAITKVSDGVYNLTYRLGLDSETGTVFNIDTRVGVGGALTGVKFRGFQSSYGAVTAHRRL